MKFPAIKTEDWPPRDRELWRQAQIVPASLADEAGVAADWSKAYMANVELFYGQFLSFLAQAGLLDPAASPEARVTKEHIDAFCEAFAPGRSEGTLGTALGGIAAVVRACHPAKGAPWLNRMAMRLARKAKPLRPKLPRTASIEELVGLGERLIADGWELIERGERNGAAIYRDGLIILTWVAHPVRRANMAALQLGKTIFVEEERIHVRFEAKDTKNGIDLERQYPAWLVRLFLEYLDVVRPILREKASGPDEGWIWIGRHGTNMIAQSLRNITTRHTERWLDRSVPPHNFRHSTVTDVALFDADSMHIIKDVLGHKSGVTSEEHYVLASSFRAFSEYQDIVESRRQRS